MGNRDNPINSEKEVYIMINVYDELDLKIKELTKVREEDLEEIERVYFYRNYKIKNKIIPYRMEYNLLYNGQWELSVAGNKYSLAKRLGIHQKIVNTKKLVEIINKYSNTPVTINMAEKDYESF